jgi:hypothetical protein
MAVLKIGDKVQVKESKCCPVMLGVIIGVDDTKFPSEIIVLFGLHGIKIYNLDNIESLSTFRTV